MGIFGSKIAAMDVPWLVKQLNDCQLPVDRNQALDYLEQIDQNLLDKKTFDVRTQMFKEVDGMRIVVKVGKRLIEDIFIVSVVAQIIEDVKMVVPLVMDFIEFGGVDMLEKSIRLHAKDDYLAGMLPKLVRVVLAVGASACIEDINEQGLNLLMCHKCQETIERTKHPFAMKRVVIPHPKDRVNRVLRFMDNFIARADVQVIGLDAVIKYCRNPDALTAAKDTEIFYVLSKCAEQHQQDTMILWRVAMAFSLLANLQGELAMAVLATNVHDVFIDRYVGFATHRLVQQQILWLFGNLLRWQRSKKMLHKSAKCMDFFKSLVGDPLADKKKLEQEARIRQLENDTRSVMSGASKPSLQTLASTADASHAQKNKNANTTNNNNKSINFSFGGANTNNNKGKDDYSEDVLSKSRVGDVSSMSKSRAYHATGREEDDERSKQHPDDPLAQENDIEDDKGPELEGSQIDVAIPVQIRSFVRESLGKLYKDAQDKAQRKKTAEQSATQARHKRLFETQPLFGTVSTRLFTPGEDGLLANGLEDENGQKIVPKHEKPEWEKHLNYGEELDKEAKKEKRAAMKRVKEANAEKMYD